jgi:hypothetical protein
MQRQQLALANITVARVIGAFQGVGKLLAPRKRRGNRAPKQSDIQPSLVTFIQQELL